MARSPNGSNGVERGSGGRFAAGNPGGPGNPYARRVAALRSVLLDAVTVEDLKELVRAMLERAKTGDVAAVKILLAYAVGPPISTTEPDRLDEHEMSVERGRPGDADREMLALMKRAVAG